MKVAAQKFKAFCRREKLKIYAASADALRMYMEQYKIDKRRK